jgi:tetratricopeptide (TPR) repeat protein
MSNGKAGRIALSLAGLALALMIGIGGYFFFSRASRIDWSTRDEVPPDQLKTVMDSHFRGLGAMERYEYAAAAQAFGEVHDKAPGWTIGSINLAIALLNLGGEAEAVARAAGQEGPAEAKKNIEVANQLLNEVIKREPRNPYALFSRGIILKNNGFVPEANNDFRAVTEIDPLDANAWFERGASLTDPEFGVIGADSKLLPEVTSYFARAVELNPNLVPALYNLSMVRGRARSFVDQKALQERWKQLNPEENFAGAGDLAKLVYGEMGRYAKIINPFSKEGEARQAAPSPRFDAQVEIQVKLSAGHRWATSSDFNGALAVIARARSRFGQGVATFDANGDGRLDLYLTAAVVGPKGLHDVLLLNQGDNQFIDATAEAGLPEDRAGLGIAAGDFDADRRVDLFLTGVGDNRLYRNLGGKFEDVTKLAGLADAPRAVSVSARWLDLDQDGDLDLYVVNYAAAADADRCFGPNPPVEGMANLAYRNDGQAAPVSGKIDTNWAPLAVSSADFGATQGLSIRFSTAFPGEESLSSGKGRHTAVAALDLDDDRDLDLVVTADGEPPRAIFNDRIGAFHAETLTDIRADAPIAGLLATDLDKDGRVDLVAVGPGGRTSAWRNLTKRTSEGWKLGFESIPIDALGWRSALAIDLDLDTWSDLIGLPGDPSSLTLAWSRNAGSRLETRTLSIAPDAPVRSPLVGFAAADLVGDALPDLVIVRDGQAPRISKNLGNGSHWLAIDLNGQWHIPPERTRTNSEGIGTRLSLEGQGINAPYELLTPAASTAQSVGPIVLGMGPNTSAPLLRVRWPDGVMQCELNVTADKTLKLVEVSRKTGSCPVLFTWNGRKFECLGDFLGGGGMGYLVAPGVYGQPDRDESVGIGPDQLKPIDGVYRLSIVEPMDEVAYLDQLKLDVVDRPPGVSSTPDERFAPEGPRPTGETLAWSKTIEPVQAFDHKGRDVTAEIREWDRKTVDQFQRLRDWTGYTEDHALILDFGDRLTSIDSNQKLVLCLAGWVEYPYSQTNYAASTAGITLRPPVLERQKPDGTWEVLDPHPGYPAGLPRMMTLDLTGKLGGSRCVLRLSTNMECFWDQAFLALADEASKVRTTSLPVARAELRDRGYLREVSPDGRLPLLYEYDYVDPAPLARMQGFLTRHGDVVKLLNTDDDQVCTVGPGDEVRLEFEAKSLPDLPPGWTRSYVLRSIGYCKDADPFTAGSDAVEPLPWRGMPPYPFDKPIERPRDPAYSAYLRDYQTRPAGVPERR